MRVFKSLVVLLGCFGLLHCGTDPACADGACVDAAVPLPDDGASGLDGGGVGGGPRDSGSVDAGLPAAADGGRSDAGAADAGAFDAGPVDAGPVDAGTPDGGRADAGPPDAGPSDAATADAGPNSCANPDRLLFDGGSSGGFVVVEGTTVGQGDRSGCYASSNSPDRVYRFVTTRVLELEATVTSLSPPYQPAVYLRGPQCAVLNNIASAACSAAPGVGGSATIRAGNLQPGAWYLWVDGVAGTSGDFGLEVALWPPAPGERCDDPLPLTFSAGADGGTASHTGQTTGFFSDTSGTCNSGVPSNDVVYRFVTERTFDFSATLTPLSAGFAPALFLRRTVCLEPGSLSNLTCQAATAGGAAVTITRTALPPGTYYLWVDGAFGSAGSYQLAARLQ